MSWVLSLGLPKDQPLGELISYLIRQVHMVMGSLNSRSCLVIDFFLIVTASSGISSESPNDNKPVFLQ